MVKKEKFHGYGLSADTAFTWMDEDYHPPTLGEMRSAAHGYLKQVAKSIVAVKTWHKPFEPQMTSKDFILTTLDVTYIVPHGHEMEHLDALEVLYWIEVVSEDADAKDYLFPLGRAWERFCIRRTGAERNSQSQMNSRNLPPKKPKDLSDDWAKAVRRFPNGPKQRRIEAVVESSGWSESTVKRWLNKSEK